MCTVTSDGGLFGEGRKRSVVRRLAADHVDANARRDGGESKETSNRSNGSIDDDALNRGDGDGVGEVEGQGGDSGEFWPFARFRRFKHEFQRVHIAFAVLSALASVLCAGDERSVASEAGGS